MTVDVHPEALLDRDARGELTAEERVHLDTHLSVCAACRFERQLRDDFTAELGTDLGPINMQGLVSGALLAARTTPDAEQTEAPVVSTRAWAGRRLAVALAATMLFVSGLAFAQTELALRVIEATREVVGLSALQARVSGKSSREKARHRRVRDDVITSSPAYAAEARSVAQVPTFPEAIALGIETPRAVGNVLGEDSSSSSPQGAVPARTHARPRERSRAALPSATARATHAETVGVVATPQALEPTPTREPEPANASELFEMAARARREGRSSEAMLIYRDLIRRYPTSPEGTTALVVAARLELDRGNNQAALAGYDAYLRGESFTLREQALVGRAQALHKLGRLAEANESVRTLKAEYPDAPYIKLESERHEAEAP